MGNAHRGVFRKNNSRPYICFFCKEEVQQGTKYYVHHRDHRHKNNVPWNLRAAHKYCHSSYHQQVKKIWWFERLWMRFSEYLPKCYIEPESKRLERWSRFDFTWRDPERIRQLKASLPAMYYLHKEETNADKQG